MSEYVKWIKYSYTRAILELLRVEGCLTINHVLLARLYPILNTKMLVWKGSVTITSYRFAGCGK